VHRFPVARVPSQISILWKSSRRGERLGVPQQCCGGACAYIFYELISVTMLADDFVDSVVNQRAGEIGVSRPAEHISGDILHDGAGGLTCGVPVEEDEEED
jgi:hypothetical protein